MDFEEIFREPAKKRSQIKSTKQVHRLSIKSLNQKKKIPRYVIEPIPYRTCTQGQYKFKVYEM